MLGAIWGASFLFMRVAVPELGPATLICTRLALAAVFLGIVAWFRSRPLPWRANWRRFFAIGTINSAIPFLLFAYGARTLPASVLSVMNSLAPLYGAVASRIWLGTPIARRTQAGLAFGVLGVAALGAEHLLAPDAHGLQAAHDLPAHGFPAHGATQLEVALAFLAAFIAPVFYGLGAMYIRRHGSQVDPLSNAQGSMWAATLVSAPVALLTPPAHLPGIAACTAAAVLGLLCTGVAYLLQFRLIADVGPTRMLTVTFLIPVFGVLWGVLFLGEAVTPGLLAGGALIVCGMYLTLRPGRTGE